MHKGCFPGAPSFRRIVSCGIQSASCGIQSASDRADRGSRIARIADRADRGSRGSRGSRIARIARRTGSRGFSCTTSQPATTCGCATSTTQRAIRSARPRPRCAAASCGRWPGATACRTPRFSKGAGPHLPPVTEAASATVAASEAVPGATARAERASALWEGATSPHRPTARARSACCLLRQRSAAAVPCSCSCGGARIRAQPLRGLRMPSHAGARSECFWVWKQAPKGWIGLRRWSGKLSKSQPSCGGIRWPAEQPRCLGPAPHSSPIPGATRC